MTTRYTPEQLRYQANAMDEVFEMPSVRSKMIRQAAGDAEHLVTMQAHVDVLMEAKVTLLEKLAAAEADAERLDWLDSKSADGVHVEVCTTGAWCESSLARKATVFIGSSQHEAPNVRDAIDASRKPTREG